MAVPENAIPELWAPAVAVGNLLALYWLLKAFLLFHPHVAAALRRKLLRLRTVCCRTPSAQGVAAAEEGRAETAGGGGGGGEKELSRHSTDSLGAAAGEAGQQSALSPAAVAGLGGGSGSVVRKLTLPVTPLLLTWKDIGCTVTESSTGAQKAVLEGVCGAAAPFQLTALLGPSGAGKSTLMDILCMRQQSNGGGGGGGGGAKMVVTGEVCVNGRPCSCSGKEVVARSAYIPQHDSFFPQLTAREVLQFYASILLQKQQQQQQVNSYGATAVPLPAATGDSDDNPRRGDGDQNPRGRIQPHQQQSQHGRSLKNFLCNLCGRSSSGSSDGDAEADGGGTGGGGELACSGCSSCARCCNCWPNHQADIAAPTADGRTPGQQIVSAAGFGTVSEASLRQQRIDEVLLALGLMRCANTVVGGSLPGGIQLRGLSGGERKRLAIAAGILARPSLLFLDEPTSGLDSFAALVVVRHLRRMAAAGAAVVASIHQPRAAIWAVFDRVLVLAAGRMMYEGPCGGVVPWFSGRLGYPYDPEVHGTVPDWVMDLVCLGYSGGGAANVVDSAPAGASAADEDNKGLQVTDAAAAAGTSASTAAAATVLVPHMNSKTELLEAARLFRQHYAPPPCEGGGGGGGSSCTIYLTGSASGAGAAGAAEPGGAAATAAAAESRPSSSHGRGSSLDVLTSEKFDDSEELPVAAADSRAPSQNAARPATDGGSVSSNSSRTATPAPATTAGGGGRLSQYYNRSVSSGTAVEGGSSSALVVRSSDSLLSSASSAATESPYPAAAAAAATTAGGVFATADLASAAAASGDGDARAASVAASAAVARDGHKNGGGSGSSSSGLRAHCRAALQTCRTWCRHYAVMTWREYLTITRNPADVAGRMLVFVYVAIFTAVINYGQKDDASSMAMRVNGSFSLLFFFIVMPFIFTSVFTADKKLYLQDASARLYHPSSYYLAKLSASLPFNVSIALVFALIVYGMIGLRPTLAAAVEFSIIAVLVSLLAFQAMFAATAAAPNQDIAFLLAVGWTVLQLLCTSFFIGTVPLTFGWLKGLRWVSALDRGWHGVVSAELQGRTFNCSTGWGTEALSLPPILIPDQPQFALVKAGVRDPGPDCVAAGDAVLGYYDVDTSFRSVVGYLLVYYFILHVLTYVALLAATARRTRGGGK